MFLVCLEGWDWPTESTPGVSWPRDQLRGRGGGALVWPGVWEGWWNVL